MASSSARGAGRTVVRLRGIHRRFVGPGGGADAEVLRGVDLEVAAGESVAVVGPSGSGKSTLLHVVAGLLRPDQGSVTVDGRDLAGLDDVPLSRLRSTQIGFVFQQHHLLPQLSAFENVLVPTLVVPTAADDTPASRAARARALLERVGLGGRIDHRPAQLSGGECQRVAVVRALINRPKIVLADEPTGSLDPAHAGELATLLLELQRDQGTALLVVTHSYELAERLDRTLELRDGRLEVWEPPR